MSSALIGASPAASFPASLEGSAAAAAAAARVGRSGSASNAATDVRARTARHSLRVMRAAVGKGNNVRGGIIIERVSPCDGNKSRVRNARDSSLVRGGVGVNYSLNLGNLRR